MTEADVYAFFEGMRQFMIMCKPYVVETFPGRIGLALVFIGAASTQSVRTESWLAYLRRTRYRGDLVCTAKRERIWTPDGSPDKNPGEGFFDLGTSREMKRRQDWLLLQADLDDGRQALLSVSRARYRRSRIGEKLPRSMARSVLRRAVFVSA